ncbi:MAG: hypothetical protein NUV57_06005 [archaeon]|nr:hypothetical protein [archaeon]
MNIIETALYKLAIEKKISLEQAKILKHLYNSPPIPAYFISKKTGLRENEVVIEINELAERRIVSEKFGFYFVNNFEEMLSELIRKEIPEKIKAIA